MRNREIAPLNTNMNMYAHTCLDSSVSVDLDFGTIVTISCEKKSDFMNNPAFTQMLLAVVDVLHTM